MRERKRKRESERENMREYRLAPIVWEMTFLAVSEAFYELKE